MRLVFFHRCDYGTQKQERTLVADLSKLGSDERDGFAFDLIAHLQSSIARGSYLAKIQLDSIIDFDFESADTEDREFRSVLQDCENQFKKLFNEIDLDEIECSEYVEKIEKVLEENHLDQYFADFLHEPIPHLHPETITHIFEQLKRSKSGEIGPFGKTFDICDYEISYYPLHLCLSPLIPRALLWDISLNDNDLHFRNQDPLPGLPRFCLEDIPAYLVSLCLSPILTINLLKEILDREFWDIFEPSWLSLPLLINPVADVWALSRLNPGYISHAFFNSFEEHDSIDTEPDYLSFGVLNFHYERDLICVDGPEIATIFTHLREIFKLCQKFSFDDGLVGMAILAARIIQEFRDDRALLEDHLNSQHGLIRAVANLSPEINNSSIIEQDLELSKLIHSWRTTFHELWGSTDLIKVSPRWGEDLLMPDPDYPAKDLLKLTQVVQELWNRPEISVVV